jgi:hypothetical protein
MYFFRSFIKELRKKLERRSQSERLTHVTSGGTNLDLPEPSENQTLNPNLNSTED